MVDIGLKSRSVWETIGAKVNKAVVFIDNACAECLHWNGGVMLLFNAGALDVKQFSSFEVGRKDDRKAVFIISGPLSGLNMSILHDILRSSSFQYVIVISSLSPAMHTIVNYGHGEDDMKMFLDAEDQLLEWMGNMNYSVEIIYQPVVMAPITPNLFMLPVQGSVFPMLPSDLDSLLPKINKDHKGAGGTIRDLEFSHVPKELQLSLKLLVCTLNSLLESLGVSEDLYALGHTSQIVASELAILPWAKNRRKKSQRKASMLIVDRSLDIPSVASHNWDSLLDRIQTLLPNLPGHNNDVCVNMAPVCSVKRNPNHTVIAPGCLSHPDDEVASQILSTLTDRKHKEALMEINRQLVEAASKENLPLKLTGRPGRVTADQLDSHVALFRGQPKAVRKHSGVLQQVLAVVETLRHPESSRLDSLLGVEKGLLLNLGEEDEAAVLCHVIGTLQRELAADRETRLYRLEDFFLLLVFVYPLLEKTDQVEFLTEERNLQELLTQAILKDRDCLPDFLKSLVGEDPHKDTVTLIIQDMFEKLKSLSRAREDLQQFDSLYDPGSLSTQPALTPLLKTVMDEVFNPHKPELPDLLYKSTGIRDLLKSGFGLFMNVTKPRPNDHPLLIVFVIGGTTATEVRQIREAVAAAKSSTQVVVGSTRLLSPVDLLNNIFVNDNLHPKHSTATS